MNDDHTYHDFQNDDKNSAELPAATDQPRRPAAAAAIAEAALDAALTPEVRSILDTRGFALVIRVPGDDWIGPTRSATVSICPDAIRFTSRERYAKSSDDEVFGALGKGYSVIGISSDLNKLPVALIRTADATLTLRLPVGDGLRAVIEAVTGSACPHVPADLGAGLSLAEASAAIRPHDDAHVAIARLARAQATLGGLDLIADAPPLESLHGYGRAMEWARGLTADVAGYRAGEILWTRVRNTALLASDPGLGKTTFVRALAHALRAPLVETSVADWFVPGDGHLGSVIKAARESHATATRLALASGTAVWFLDEIDALPDRATLDSRHREWWTTVIAQVLKLIEDRAPGMIVIGATNHADHLDAALVRPGRLDPTIVISPPGADAVPGILRVHLGADLPNADLAALGPLGAGRTGAALAGVVARARAAARTENRALQFADLVAALAPPDTRPASVRRRVAVHEAGHAVAAHLLGMRLERVSMISAGVFGGSTQASGENGLMTRRDIDARVVIALAGRAAEDIMLGEVSAGATLDLMQATDLIAKAHLTFGLGERLSSTGDAVGSMLALDRGLRVTIEAELAEAYSKAVDMISDARRSVQRVADALLEKRLLSGTEAQALIAGTRAYIGTGKRGNSGDGNGPK